MSDHAAIEALARQARGEPIDILAQQRRHRPAASAVRQTDYRALAAILEVNLIGPMKLAESFVEHVAASGCKVMAFVSSRMGSIALNLTGGSYAYRSARRG